MEKVSFEGIGERVRQIRLALKLPQRQFAQRFFVSQTLVNEIELGKREPNIRVVHLIAAQFNVNIKWLKTGVGKMFSAPPPDMRLESIIDIYNQLDKPLKDYLVTQSKELLKIQKEMG